MVLGASLPYLAPAPLKICGERKKKLMACKSTNFLFLKLLTLSIKTQTINTLPFVNIVGSVMFATSRNFKRSSVRNSVAFSCPPTSCRPLTQLTAYLPTEKGSLPAVSSVLPHLG